MTLDLSLSTAYITRPTKKYQQEVWGKTSCWQLCGEEKSNTGTCGETNIRHYMLFVNGQTVRKSMKIDALLERYREKILEQLKIESEMSQIPLPDGCRPSRPLMILEAIAEYSDLCAEEKLMHACIDEHIGNKFNDEYIPFGWPRIEELANRMGVELDRAELIIESLEAHGLIARLPFALPDGGYITLFTTLDHPLFHENREPIQYEPLADFPEPKHKPAKRIVLTKKKRFEILKRDNFTCQYCGAKAPDAKLHVDHVKPVTKGGENHDDNLVAACVDCNLGKGDTYGDR